MAAIPNFSARQLPSVKKCLKITCGDKTQIF